VLFARQDWAEGIVPLAPLAWPRDCLHILHNYIGEWEHLVQLGKDPCFGFPSIPR
jgi:hypothetical protein